MGNIHLSVSDLLEELVIKEYLRTHPGVTRDQVAVKSVNGKAVCETIQKAATQNKAARNYVPGKDSLEDALLMEHLETSEEQRMQAVFQSIVSSTKLMDFLAASDRHPFGADDKDAALDFLKKCKNLMVARTTTVEHVKKGFMQVMDGVEAAAPWRIRGLVTGYIEAIFEQLKAQGGIYRKEHELGNEFCACVQGVIKDDIPAVRDQLEPKVAECVALVWNTTQREGTARAPVLITKGAAKLGEAVKYMEGHLEKRRSQFQAIEKIVAFLEEMASGIKVMKDEEKKAASGMAFDRRPSRSARR